MATEDNALKVLLQVLHEEGYELSEAVVRQCYAVQKQFQFDRDREVPLDRKRRIVEAEVVRQMESSQVPGGDNEAR